MSRKNVDLFVGFDLSFNSTGLCVLIVDSETKNPITIDFQLVLFDKQYKPIRGVKQNKYIMPVSVSIDDMQIGNVNGDYYQEDQIYITQKYTNARINIIHIVKTLINDADSLYNVKNIIMSIEGLIMPDIMGSAQFRSISGLMMMQGCIRSDMIKLYRDRIKLNVVSPTKLKYHFTNNGNASKIDMLETFVNVYDGETLIDCSSVAKVNDVIDAFALNVNGLHKHYYIDNYNLNYGDLDQKKHDKKIELKVKRKALLKRQREIDKQRVSEGKLKKSETIIINHNQWIPEI